MRLLLQRLTGAYQGNGIDERTSAVISLRVIGIEGIADVFGLLLGDEGGVSSVEKHIQGIKARIRLCLVP